MDTALSRGLRLLEAVVRAGAPVSVSALARQMGWAKSNVHNLIQTLVAIGYLRRVDEEGRYCPTARLARIGARSVNQLPVWRAAQRHIQRLARKTRENVNLSMLDRGEVLYLQRIDSPRYLRIFAVHTGGSAPSYCSSTGKALLAYQPSAVIAGVCRRLQPFTPRTIRTARELRQHLAKVRKAGYAINDREWHHDLSSVAAPILDQAGKAVAAVSVGGPSDRLPPTKLRKLASVVRATATAISRELAQTTATPTGKTRSRSGK